MKYIGVISDTHCCFDEKIKEFLSPVDTIWHSGDFGNIQTANSIASFKTLIGVYGNCDDYTIRLSYPLVQIFTIDNLKVLMTHIGGFPGRYTWQTIQLLEAHRPDIFVCGHSHILRVINDKRLNILTINPGAAGISGIHKVRTAIRFKIDGKNIYDMEVGEWDKKI